MTREMLSRFYVEVTNPDELGLTDPRFKIVFDMALQALDRDAVLEEVTRRIDFALSQHADDWKWWESWARQFKRSMETYILCALKREPSADPQAAVTGEAYARDLLRKLRRWLLEINHGYPEVKAYPLNRETELGLFLEEVSAYLEHSSATPAVSAPDVAEMVKRLRDEALRLRASVGWTIQCALIEEAAALLARLGQEDQYGWLIERFVNEHYEWFAGWNNDGHGFVSKSPKWTRDAFQAIRFCRKKDGENIATYDGNFMDTKVTSHGFLTPAPGASDE